MNKNNTAATAITQLIEQTSNHPLWQDFKHLKLNIDCAIIFPEGAGGNFIASLLMPEGSTAVLDLNEYKSAEMFILDTYGYREVIPIVNLNNLYNLVKMSWQSQTQLDKQVLLGHNIPFFTDSIFTVECEELVLITVDEESQMIPFWLERVKNLFQPDYNDKNYNIHSLLNYVKNLLSKYENFVPFISFQDNHLLEKMLQGLDKNVVDSNSLLAWYYLLECKARIFPMNIDTFKQFSQEIIMDIDSFQNQYIDAYSGVQISQLKETWKKITMIDYVDLFFKLDIPRDSRLSNINKDDIRSYSRKNLELIKDMCVVLPDAYSSQVNETVKQLDDLLNSR